MEIAEMEIACRFSGKAQRPLQIDPYVEVVGCVKGGSELVLEDPAIHCVICLGDDLDLAVVDAAVKLYIHPQVRQCFGHD